MVTMASMAPGLHTSPTPTHHLIYCRVPPHNGLYRVMALACILFLFTLSWLSSAVGCDPVSYVAHGLQESLVYDDDGKGCGVYEDNEISAIYVQKSSQGCNGVRNVFARPDSFCFLTTLASFLGGSDSFEGSSLKNPVQSRSKSHPLLDESLDRIKVSCFSVDINSEEDEGIASGKENLHCDDIRSCGGPVISDPWMQGTNGLDFPFYRAPEGIQSKVPNGALLPHVNITPPFLDWGITHLYFPSKAFLTVANAHNDSILKIYKPFSTNSQYSAFEFEQLSLAPGEATSIGFVFLPRWLGSSSAHLVLQTNFGGFVINAKGTAVDSPYRIQPLVGFDVASDGKLSKTLSMHNPLDDGMHIEEVRALVSISYDNISHSTHVVCRRQPSDLPSGDFIVLPNSNKWFSLEHGESGQSFVGMRTHRQWELPPHNTENIMEISLFTHKEGNFSGAIYMKFHSSSHGKHDTVVIPLEAHVQDRIGYHTPSSSISVFFEPALPCKNEETVFSLLVRNGASYSLRLVKIVEITDAVNLFVAKYMEGLVLYPGTVTHVGLVLYSSNTNSMEISTSIPAVSLNCKLAVVTNDSVSPQIEVPCEDLVKTCRRHESLSGFMATDISYVDFGLQHEEKQSTNARTGSLGNTGEEPLPIELSPVEGREIDEVILQNWRSHATMVGMSVLERHEVLFPVVQVGKYHSKWITVKNPSQKPVLMQLVLNSAVIVDQCKSVDALSEQPVFTRSVQMHSMRNMYGFSIAEAGIVEAFVHPLGTVEFGPVIFHPSSRCMWRSSALIRNNLSGVEWLTLQGVGGLHSLIILEGSKPVKKLMFDLELPTNLNISSKEISFHEESSSAACARFFSKELYAKNAGEFPVEVIKLDISGYSCGLNGFVIQNCKGFTLEPGESTRFLISFQPDFSSAVIHRDLELVMSTGILVIPIKASLPMNMLKLCRKPILWTLLIKLFLLVLFTALVSVLFCALSHVSSIISEDLSMKRNKNTATISMVGKSSRLHRNSKSARSLEECKPEATMIKRYPHCTTAIQDNTVKPQGKQDSDHQNKTLSSSSVLKNMGEAESSCKVETPHPDNLTIRVTREKSRRKKRRAGGAGAGLAAKLEVSSSQSGNSTPSSPLSPGDRTPRQAWPASPQAPEHPFARGAELNHEKDRRISLGPAKAQEADASMNCGNCSVSSACEQLSLPEKPCSRPVLLPSATFPGAGRRMPGIVAPIASTSTSPIAPHARAPGSKLSAEKTLITDEGSASGGEYIYNIWGNHFCDHLLQRTRESPRRASDASEGDSQSFFARDPQTLMMVSSARSVNPNPEQSFDVHYPLQKG